MKSRQKDEDHLCMYRVSHRVNLENHTITVCFAKGSMGFIAHGLLEIIPKPSQTLCHNKDPVYMCKVVDRINLESYTLTVQFQPGATGYIPTGVLSTKRKK